MKSSTTNSTVIYPNNSALDRAVGYAAVLPPCREEGDEAIELSKVGSSGGCDPLLKNTLGNFEHSDFSIVVLETARARLEAALTGELRQQAPWTWAATNDHLGTLLATLGQSQGDEGLFDQALQAFESALEERHQDNSPLEWAATQSNLGLVLQALGQRRRDTKSFTRAVDAFTSALEGYTRQQTPQEWALAMHHLGTTFYLQGSLLKGSRTFQKSVVAFNNALAEFNADRDPLEYTASLSNRGTVLRGLAESEAKSEGLVEALESYQSALKAMLEEQLPFHLAVMTRINIAAARNALAQMKNDAAPAQQAADELEVVVAAFEDSCHPDSLRRAEDELTKAEALLGNAG